MTIRAYTSEINEYWPTIVRAWKEYANKCPVIECDLTNKTVAAYPAKEYIDDLSERTRETARTEYNRVVEHAGIMVFIRDNKNRILQSFSFPSSELNE